MRAQGTTYLPLWKKSYKIGNFSMYASSYKYINFWRDVNMNAKIRQMSFLTCICVMLAISFSACGKISEKAYYDTSRMEVNYNGISNMSANITAEMEYMGNNGFVVQEDFNTEDYNTIYENKFLDTVNNPLSTFSIDVDTASYSNVRRFLSSGTKPPVDAVRIEEMINYFKYDYPQPEGEDPFSVTTEIAPCPWNEKNKLLLIGLQGEKIESKDLPPSNLVFLLDVSGSMDEPNKLPLIKSGFKLMVDQLREEDRVAIVVYAGAAGLVLDSTSGKDKDKILSAISNLEAGGSTAGAEGIELAYKIAKKNFIASGNNRVILATDGDFNVGVSSESELTRLIEKKRKEGIFLTVLGFGTGNIKDSKMESLADKGNGNYAYIDNIMEARKVLVNEMGSTLFTIAKDVKIQVEFNPAKVKSYRLIGYENRLLAKEDFNNDLVDAGELGAGHSVTALYEIVTEDSDVETSSVDKLKYQESTLIPSDEIATLKLRYKKPGGDESKLLTYTIGDQNIKDSLSNNMKIASTVAEFGMLLRDSQYKGTANYDAVLQRANEVQNDDTGYWKEFIGMVRKAASMK